ncbi:hypothetical protein MNBD_GAMMA14-244 [hydrothermal vent metagenome]|uniref:DUF4861 domain-containing protein n=1 Tax=hydrothermal vent metagenome TaxID=652676 RepID=A0A3B0YGL0_9ZZZZ
MLAVEISTLFNKPSVCGKWEATVKHFITCIMCFYLGGLSLAAGAAAMTQLTVWPATNCGSPDSLVVMPAEKLPALLGKPVNQITLLNYRDQQLLPITIQIDPRDDEGRFLLDDTNLSANPTHLLGPKDEIVFRLADRASRFVPGDMKETPLVEIQVNDSKSGQTGWVYTGLSGSAANVPVDKAVDYTAAEDSIETNVYKVGFSGRYPFLIDTFQWKLAANTWSPNVLDAMKIRHRGNMFGFISFRRTSNDYSSRLTRVKEGPLRVIRRTENRIRILWKLKTPALYVDYVMMPDSFVMDTIVDIPFNLGLFFSDVETLTTVDWRKGPALPELTIRSPGTRGSLVVDGTMSEEKSRFNTLNDTRLSVYSAYGAVHLTLDIPEDFAIQPWLYLSDRMGVADRPENQPGQFGNVGYRTTGWENIDTEVHHLKFTTCVTPVD